MKQYNFFHKNLIKIFILTRVDQNNFQYKCSL